MDDPMEACRNGQDNPVDAYSSTRDKAVEACNVDLQINKNSYQRGQHQRSDCKDSIETALWKPADAQSNSIKAYREGCHMHIFIDN